MKIRHLYTLAAIFAFLTVGIIVQKLQSRPEVSVQEYQPLDLSFQNNQVTRITIFRQSGSEAPQVELVKENEGWKIPALWNAGADEAKITSFLNEIRGAGGELRGRSKEVLGDFGIGDDEGFHVRLYDAAGKELVGFVIGTRRADYSKIFVRKINSDMVYLSKAEFYSQIGVFGKPEEEKPAPNHWLSKKFASFIPPDVNKIEIQRYRNGTVSSELVLEKKDERWEFLGRSFAFPPASEKVMLYLNILQNNPAEDVVDPLAKDYGFHHPRLRIRLMGRLGTAAELTVGNPDSKDETAFYLQSAMEKPVFVISKYTVEQLAQDAVWFVSDNPLDIEASKIEKLVIRAGKEERIFHPMIKQWDALTSYLEGLKEFPLNSAKSGKARFGKYWIEIQKQGENQPLILDVSENPVTEGGAKFYSAKRRGTDELFTLPQTYFSRLFDNLSRIDDPKPNG